MTVTKSSMAVIAADVSTVCTVVRVRQVAKI